MATLSEPLHLLLPQIRVIVIGQLNKHPRDTDKGPSVANTETENSQDVREIGRTRRAFLEDFILFNNPERPNWERTDLILKELPFREGDKIADIGCGGGYFSYRFTKLVGDTGVVYALDIKKDHLDFIDTFANGAGIKNIKTVLCDTNDLKLKTTIDHAFICSLYHIIYGVNSFEERDAWLRSLKKILKVGGTLTVVDNGPVSENTLPYHGPFIAKELIIAQLAQYGFSLNKHVQIIPQRYLLEFSHEEPNAFGSD